MDVFGVTEHFVCKAHKFCSERGILAEPEPKWGKSLPTDSALLVEAFYRDKYTRLMPGRKDYFNIKCNIHQQKRLILCNLNELFRAFKEQNPTASLGLSKFYSLRLKCCVLAGSADTHAVCVYTRHQNMKLLLELLNVSYQDFLKYIVYNTSNKECMIHRCPNWLKSSGQLEKFLYDTIEGYIDNAESIVLPVDNNWPIDNTKGILSSLIVLQLNKLVPHWLNNIQSLKAKKRLTVEYTDCISAEE